MQVCNNIPSIVYQNSWTGQTSSLSASTIFTPSSSGVYRISVALDVSGGGGGDVEVDLWWNASGGVGTDLCTFTYAHRATPDNNGVTPAGNSYVAVLAASQVVKMQTVVSGSISTYDFYVTIEQLQ